MNFKAHPLRRTALVCAAVVTVLSGCAGVAQTSSRPVYFLSIQDGRAGLNDGQPVVRTAADTLAVIEVSGERLRIAHEVAMPTSLVGPPSSIAVAPGGKLALVTAATRRDPVDAGKVVPFDQVAVVRLDPSGVAAPLVLNSLQTGAGASGVSVNASGTLALVANRVEGSVSVLAIDGEQVSVVGKVPLGEKAGPAHAAFTPDGKRALVTRDGDNRITVLAVSGRSVTVEQRSLYAGLRPYGLDISPDGAWAAVTNLGAIEGDVDTISLIDLRVQPTRVVDTVSVGQTPEGVFFSPDSRTVGVTVIDGSNKPKASPFYGPAHYRTFDIVSGKFQPAGRVELGQWLQGHAFTPDGQTVLVQDAASRRVHLLRRKGSSLVDTGSAVTFDGAPATLRFWR